MYCGSPVRDDAGDLVTARTARFTQKSTFSRIDIRAFAVEFMEFMAP